MDIENIKNERFHYDFIEIGTSDFDSLSQLEESKNGISVEPLKIYLDRLPNKEGIVKVNCAISNVDGESNIFWIHPSDIEKYELPWWLKGCSSLYSPHPAMIRELRERNLNSLLRMSTCPMISWETLVRNYRVKSVDFLKIDTEGHDCVILNGILDSSEKIYPRKINFESNGLVPEDEVNSTINKLISLGYTIISRDGWEVVAEIN